MARFALLFTALTLTLYSCKESEAESVNDFRDQYVSSIISDVINLESGKKINMDADTVSKIFYLIRHAEKDTIMPENPPLSETGLKRAERLAELLKGTRVDAIYSTMFLRTLYTVDSLADIKGMKVQPYDNTMLKGLINELKENSEIKSVLFVGHSNTIPSIANTLAGKEIYNQAFNDGDYDNIAVIVHFKGGTQRAYPLRYK